MSEQLQLDGARPPLRLLVAVPSHDLAPVLWAFDLAKLMAWTGAVLRPEDSLGINLCSGTYIHSARQDLALAAIQQEATHVLWLDSDMSFPRDTLLRLLAHGKHMVGANYCSRTVPPRFVAIKKMGLDPGVRSERLPTLGESTGLEEVDAIGFGAVLMTTELLFAAVEDGPPLFGNEWIPGKNQWMGEDVFFCRKVRALGFHIWVDHDLSKECGHYGQLKYELPHAAEFMGRAEQAE